MNNIFYVCCAVLSLVGFTAGQFPSGNASFTTINELRDVLRNSSNILLTQIKAVPGNLYEAQAIFGSLNVSLQFPWPLSGNCTITLDPNVGHSIPNFEAFRNGIQSQLGVHSTFPLLREIGIGNFGLSLNALELKLQDRDVKEVSARVSIPGWDVFTLFYFKVLNPQIVITFQPRPQKLLAVKSLGNIVSLASMDSTHALPVEFILPDITTEPLQVKANNPNAVTSYKHIMKFLTISRGLNIPDMVWKALPKIKITNLDLTIEPGLSNISNVVFEAVANEAWNIGGDFTLNGAQLKIMKSDVKFSATARIGKQSVRLRYDNNHGNALQLDDKIVLRDLEEMTRYILRKTVARSLVSLPDFSYVKIYGSNLGGRLESFDIAFSNTPKNVVNISMVFKLTKAWSIFNNNLLATSVQDTAVNLKITSLNENPNVNVSITGTIVLGNPKFLEYPFSIQIPHRIQPLTVSLLPGRVLQVNFANVLKIEGIANLPDVFKDILSKANYVDVTKLELEFPSNFISVPLVSGFELHSFETWDLNYVRISKASLYYSNNHYTLSGQLEFLGVSTNARLSWPTNTNPVITISDDKINLKDHISTFANRLSKLLNGEDLRLNLKRVGLENIKDCTILSISVILTQNFRSVKQLKMTAALPKYSWKLFEDFFVAQDITITLDVIVGRSIAMTIEGNINLVSGAMKVPFQMNIPTSSIQNITIALGKGTKAVIGRFQDIEGFLQSSTGIRFPVILGSYLPELHLNKLEIAFTNSLRKMKVMALHAKCPRRWNVGGLGILYVDALQLNITDKLYDVYGNFSIGGIAFDVQFDSNAFQKPMFRLLKSVTFLGVSRFITETFRQILPKIKPPNGNLLGLSDTKFEIQQADLYLSKDLKRLTGIEIEIHFLQDWSFFSKFFTMKHVSLRIKATEFYDIKVDYDITIYGIMELTRNGRKVSFPLKCDLKKTVSLSVAFELTTPVTIKMSDVLLMPLVGKLIPNGLINPVSDLIGPIRINAFHAQFRSGDATSLKSLNMSTTALNSWNIPGLPVTFQDMTFEIWYLPYRFKAQLFGKITIFKYPLPFRIPFQYSSRQRLARLQRFVPIQFLFRGIPGFKDFPRGLSLDEIANLLLPTPNFDLKSLLPDEFSRYSMTFEKFNLRMVPPLTRFTIDGFDTKFHLLSRVNLIKNWLAIERLTVDLDVQIKGGLQVSGFINCLVRFGSSSNGFSVWSSIVIPTPPSSDWTLKIIPDSSTKLTLAKAASILFGGIDIKSFFPSKWLAKVTDIQLTDLELTFSLKPTSRVERVKCFLQSDLSDIDLPLKLSIRNVKLYMDVIFPFDAVHRKVNAHLELLTKIGKETIQTSLYIKPKMFYLEAKSVLNSGLDIEDLAGLVGSGELLRLIPKGFFKAKSLTLNKLNMTFRKPDFQLQDIYILCDLNGFDAGFSFPLPLPDRLKNMFRAKLKVSKLELQKKRSTWSINANIMASISGIQRKIDAGLQNLEAGLRFSSDDKHVALEIKKKILDLKIGARLGGIDLDLRIQFHKPKILFPYDDVVKISADIDVSGFQKLNWLLPFNVFDDEVKMAVVIQPDDERPLRLQMKTLPILENIIPCKKLGDGEFKCDFTWLCNPDSYVYLKSPSFSYTDDGFESSVDVQGIDKLCIPVTPRFLWKFIEKIPILGRLFAKNFPLWPPPNIKILLRKINIDTNNLPRGMEQFLNPKFPDSILTSVTLPHNGPIQLSLKVANGESLIVPNVLSFPFFMSGVVFREFTIGTFFNFPFVNIDIEVYIWNLPFLIPLSHLPKQNPLLVNAMDFETRIICKDCYFVIFGIYPIPIFAAPFHLSFPLLNDVQPTVTVYHKRPGFKDFVVFANLLNGLFKFFTDKDYLLSINDFGGVNASKDLLVVKLNHENYKTMVQLPKYMGQTQLVLDIPPLDSKSFLIGYLNYFKTFKLKWLLKIVPLKYRIVDAGINIGAFNLASLKFAASTPDELKDNKHLWKYPVVATGDDALVLASLDTLLLSLNLKIKAKSMIDADLNFTLEAGFTDVVKLDLEARAMINLKDMSNPLLLGGQCSLYLFGTKLLTGSAYVSVREILVSGQLKFNFLGLLKFNGFVKASFRSGEFLLSSKVGVEFVGIKFFDSYLRIQNSLRTTEVLAKTYFMGSSLQLEIIRNGLSFELKGSALIDIGVNIDLGDLKLFGKNIGRIKLNAGVLVDLKISLPGKSSLLISFHFIGEKISLPKLEVDTKDCRPDRIPRLVLNWLKEKALSLIKSLFSLNPEKYLKALMDGVIKIGKAAIKIVKDLLKAGHKFIGSVAKEIGRLANKVANAAKEVAKVAEKAKKAAIKAAKALRETAEKAVKKAKETVKAVGNVLRDVNQKLGQITEKLSNTIRKVVRLENVVKQAKKIVKAIAEGIKNVARNIERIAKKIFDEIARGIRNVLGKIKKVFRWFGKRSLYYRRDVLTSEKSYLERRKGELEGKQSNTITKLRAQERELKRNKDLEAMQRATKNKALKESETSNENLQKAIRDDIEKTAFVEDLENKGKCITGENNCHPNATCLRTGERGESFKCICRRGWKGDGISCYTPIREVSIIADEASAVGAPVNIAAFTLSGINVEYKFSFQDTYNSSSYQTYIFNKPGIYKVGVFARNTISNASDETSVVIQEPASNIKLMINGDRRPCRPLEIVPSSGGTNVTFDIIFGDNTTSYNITKSITHYFGLSGIYKMTVIARNLVSSVNSTYILKIWGTPCDQMYCDISGLERKWEGKPLQDIANLAWEMTKSSKDVITYSDPPAWKYFAPLNPQSTKNLNKPYSKVVNQKRIYSINGSEVDMALVYAGILASLMKDADSDVGSVRYQCKKIRNVTVVQLLEGLLEIQENDILNFWRANIGNDYYCNQIVLREARIIGSVDGYLIGGMVDNSTLKLSDVIYNYYCPNLANAITLPFVSKNRYDVFLDTLKTKFPQKNLKLLPFLNHVAEQIKSTSKREDHQSSSSICLGFLASYLSQRIKQKNDKNDLHDACASWKSCGECLSFGGKGNCSWCGESSKCIQKMNMSACQPLKHITNLPCRNPCSNHSNCEECMQNSGCDWCSFDKVHPSTSGFCTEGSKNGPLQPGFCNKQDWFTGQCGRNCYTHNKCSGSFGKCRSGKCTCVTGYYGPECSKMGCIYRIGFKDTADSIARLFHIKLEDLPSHDDGRLILAPNAVITIPVSNTNKLCLNHPKKATFHPFFPRLLRGSKNLVNKNSYCGLYGSLAKEVDSLFCKNVSDEEQCKTLSQCTWNAIDPCTGVPVEGCNTLSTTTQLLVPENTSIPSPISGNIETGKDFVLISGWPGSEWENCVINISHIRPLNITSVQAGGILGFGALEGNPILPNYFEVTLTREGTPRNPEEYLLPCALGCVQLHDLGNGICDTRCNVSECNFDDGDCLDQSTFRRQIQMTQNMQFEIFTDKSWHVLYKLFKMTREDKIEITRGALSVFGLSGGIVSEMLVSSALTSPMVYSKYKATMTKHFNALLTKNSTKGQMIVALAQQITEIGSEASSYLTPNEESQTIDINTKSLKNPKEFEVALQVLQRYEQLIYVKVDSNFSTGSFFHLEIAQEEHDDLCTQYQYKIQSYENKCDGVLSCYGHGICSAHGSCLCDTDYEGIDCKTSRCPNNCSSHGACINGQCVCERGWKGNDCSTVKLCTASCLDIWIGDGTCDSNCNTPLCEFDGNDCLNVCTCPKSWLGDDTCDMSCNTTICGYDKGDCVKETECSQGCKSSMVGDGFCDRECKFESCSFDNGDCEMKEACSCGLTLQGNGVCNKECNTKECMFDFGDCVTEFQVSKLCPNECLPSMVGNGFCDLICNVSACGFDGQDCLKHENEIKSPCSPGCLSVFLKDGSCDSVCNVKACNYDEGDCPKPIVEMCHTGCTMAMVGDGKCQTECVVSQCSYDATDCECAPGCPHSSIGNGKCEPKCLTASCLYDRQDCTCPPENCPEEIIGDGICNEQCNNRICNFDGGDCNCVPGCSINSVNDGWCDKECDVKKCSYDGLDCGGCLSDSHFNLCDQNAECITVNDSLPFIRCQCKPGYYGDGYQCFERGKCFNRSEVCSNNAKCVNMSGKFECYCNKGWRGNGLFCENIDECTTNQNNCSNKAVCVDTLGSYTCKCLEGYSGDGLNCYDINECEARLHTCCGNEKCVNTIGSYNCGCEDGWAEVNTTNTEETKNVTNKSSCTWIANPPYFVKENCIDVDECTEELDNCSRVNGVSNAQCENTIGGFNCTCNAGWRGDGWFCTDVDECDYNDTCGENQVCRNILGSFLCSCKNGWIFNQTGSGECEDIDECALGINKCSEFATCTNTNGSYYCSCRDGFEDIGKTCTNYKCINSSATMPNTTVSNMTSDVEANEVCSCIGSYRNVGRECADIDECIWETYDCPAYAPVCINNLGGYECHCDAINNSTCEVFNPCTAENNTCGANMTCVVSGLDHYCVCPIGYIEDPTGASCVDRDECLSPEKYKCPDNAECVNTPGSYQCKCQEGFYDIGGSCFEINECHATLTQRIDGRLQECKHGICASELACIYYTFSNNSQTTNSSLVCACNQDDSKTLDCVDSQLNVEADSANRTVTVLTFPWHSMFNSTNSSSPVPPMFIHNCSASISGCENTLGSYKCICNPGYYSNDSRNCRDDDECKLNGTCHSNASCNNTIGSYECSCNQGFRGDGKTNCTDINECMLGNYSCHENATCLNIEGGYICRCKGGYQGNGTFCEDINECVNSSMNNCHPRAVCRNNAGGYDCECTKGYSGNGFRCTDIDECNNGSQLCGSHATCYNIPGTYICKCDQGWTGDGQNCTNINECQLGMHSCIENSQCQDYDGGYVCTCNKGWTRQWFEPYGRCSGCDSNEICSGHGQCLRDGSCDCLSYFGGNNCSFCDPNIRCSSHGTCDINGTCYCESGWTRKPLDCSVCVPEELCSGHGQCNYDLTTYSNTTCYCNVGYTGQNCSNACPIIGGEVCSIHGDCPNNPPHPLSPCICHTGYQWNSSASSCVDVNECTAGLHDCVAPAICVNTEGSYRCKCPSLIGWSLIYGRFCNDTDECQYADVCDIHATCYNYPGGYRCNCIPGWKGSGEHPVCTDSNECSEGSHKCSAGSTCVNTVGSYKCICNSGYEKVSKFRCVDINECSRGIHGCDPQARCINTIGSWRCQCNDGWYPVPTNARLPVCKDLNECVDKPGACPQSSRCVNTVGSYHCICLSGWTNNGPHTCVDVNECTRNPCPSNSRCVNTMGSYKCYCNSGYGPRPPVSATSCSDINECSSGTYSCPAYSRCVNLIGSYRCDCNRCYHRYGSGCRADCRAETRTYGYYTTVYYASYYSTKCGWHGLSRCRRSRQRGRQQHNIGYQLVYVAQRVGASCPCR